MDIFNYILTAHMKIFIDCYPPELYKIYQLKFADSVTLTQN